MGVQKRKLILVDGLPGTGKSTTSQWLQQSFSQQCDSARWFYELARDHPLRHDSEIRKISGDELVFNCLRMWGDFVSFDITGYNAIIIDSGFFQKDVLYMMSQDVSEKEILAYSKNVEKLLEKFDSFLIYLSHGNTREHICETYKSRGSIFETALIKWSTNTRISKRKNYRGLAGSIKYWSDYKTLCDHIFSACSFSKVNIDISKREWTEYQSKLSSLFGLNNSLLELVLNSNDVKWVEGRYKMVATGRLVEVAEKQGELKITNLLHTLEDESVMIPSGQDAYRIRGHDVELQFNNVESKNSLSMKVKSSWAKIDGDCFQKVS